MDLLASCDQHYRNLRRGEKNLVRQSSINLAASIITVFMRLVETNTVFFWSCAFHFTVMCFPFTCRYHFTYSFTHAILYFDTTRCQGVGARLSCANRGTQVCSDPNDAPQSRRQISPNEQYFD